VLYLAKTADVYLQQDLAAELPDGIFSNQKAQLGKLWKVLQWKTMVNCVTVRSILRSFGIFYGRSWLGSWYIFTRFGMLYRVKSGNPAWRGVNIPPVNQSSPLGPS
jgi:hypothetical protein